LPITAFRCINLSNNGATHFPLTKRKWCRDSNAASPVLFEAAISTCFYHPSDVPAAYTHPVGWYRAYDVNTHSCSAFPGADLALKTPPTHTHQLSVRSVRDLLMLSKLIFFLQQKRSADHPLRVCKKMLYCGGYRRVLLPPSISFYHHSPLTTIISEFYSWPIAKQAGWH